MKPNNVARKKPPRNSANESYRSNAKRSEIIPSINPALISYNKLFPFCVQEEEQQRLLAAKKEQEDQEKLAKIK